MIFRNAVILPVKIIAIGHLVRHVKTTWNHQSPILRWLIRYMSDNRLKKHAIILFAGCWALCQWLTQWFWRTPTTAKIIASASQFPLTLCRLPLSVSAPLFGSPQQFWQAESLRLCNFICVFHCTTLELAFWTIVYLQKRVDLGNTTNIKAANTKLTSASVDYKNRN